MVAAVALFVKQMRDRLPRTRSQGLQFLPDVGGTLKRFHSFLKHDGRLAAAVWGPPDAVQFALSVGVIVKELELPPPLSDDHDAHEKGLFDPCELCGAQSSELCADT